MQSVRHHKWRDDNDNASGMEREKQVSIFYRYNGTKATNAASSLGRCLSLPRGERNNEAPQQQQECVGVCVVTAARDQSIDRALVVSSSCVHTKETSKKEGDDKMKLIGR